MSYSRFCIVILAPSDPIIVVKPTNFLWVPSIKLFGRLLLHLGLSLSGGSKVDHRYITSSIAKCIK